MERKLGLHEPFTSLEGSKMSASKIQNVTIQEIRHANMYNSIKVFAIIKRWFSYYQRSKVSGKDWDESGRGPQAL